jgi:hypothetical protein
MNPEQEAPMVAVVTLDPAAAQTPLQTAYPDVGCESRTGHFASSHIHWLVSNADLVQVGRAVKYVSQPESQR